MASNFCEFMNNLYQMILKATNLRGTRLNNIFVSSVNGKPTCFLSTMTKIFSHIIIVIVLISKTVFSQCTFTATSTFSDVTCNGLNNGSASANVSGGTAPYTYSWSTGATTSSVSGLAPGNYSVVITDASCIVSGVELIVNGDFSAGNTGFTSNYVYCNTANCLIPEGTYAIGSSPSFFHSGFCNCPDHTSGTGDLMIVNGSAIPGSNVWCQTITVTPNTTYNFSTWVTSLNTISPASLQFSVNGVPLGGIFNAPNSCCPWLQFFAIWNSGTNTSATICIVNQNTTFGGNDFALDDISFRACNTCTATATVTITEPPALSVTGSTTNEFCNRSDGTASVVIFGGSGSYTYAWTPSGQTTSSATGLAAGNHSITVSDANGCTYDTVLTVNFTPGPTANAGNDVSICYGNVTSLNASGGINYVWLPTAGLSNPFVSNPVASPTVTTVYTVMVTDANNCTSGDDIAVTVFPRPTANFSVTSSCFNNPNQFTDLSSGGNIMHWNWDFGDGIIDSIQNPSHTYNTAGTFTATLIVTTTEGCKDTISLPVNVYPLPFVSFSSTTVCVGNPTCFTDMTSISSGTITTWSWNFGDPNSGPNNISNAQHPCHVFSAVGTYNVLLTVTSNFGCQSTTLFPATVLAPPVAAFSASSVCLNSPTVFTNNSVGGMQWFWQFGDGNTSTQQHPSHTYLGYGNYIVTLIVSSSPNCADTIMDTVTVNPIPIVNFVSDTVCMGDTTSFLDLSFIPSGTISQWFWNFGNGHTSSLQNPQHVFSYAGNHTVTLTAVSNNGCSVTVPGSVLVHPLPVADFSSSPPPVGLLVDVVEFTDLSSGSVVQWFWDFGDGDTTSQQNPSHLYSDTGIYIVTLVAISDKGCRDTVRYPYEIRDFAFYIPSAFTPNEDGKNDFFFAKGIGIKEFEMWIFDRWGNMIFYCKTNDSPEKFPCLWDGIVKGGNSDKPVQQDVYVWKIRFINIFKKEYNLTGNVNVVR